MRRLKTTIVGLTLWFTSWAHAEPPVISDELPADTLIVMQRGACEGRCPVYNVTIYSDASAVVDRRHYAGKPGISTFNLDRSEVQKLLSQAEQIRFFDRLAKKENVRNCRTPSSDGSAVVLTVSSKGQSRTIVHDRICQGSDALALFRLESSIDAAVDMFPVVD